MKRYLLLFTAVLFLSLSACTMVPTIPPNPSNPVYTVAVLPVYNATTDVEAPQMVREAFAERIQNYHYSIKPINEVDQILRNQMGITLGGQLEMTTPQKLGETLGVDGLIYGYLLNFDDITTGVYNVKKVRAGFKLVHAKTGRIIWARGQGVKSELTSGGLLGTGVALARDVQDRQEGMEPFKSIKGIENIPGLGDWHLLERQTEQSIGDAAIISLGGKLIGKALGVHLKYETDRMLDMILVDFPAGPGAPVGVAVLEEPVLPGMPPMPEISIPQPAMPQFGITGYMDFGDRDFTAIMKITTIDVHRGGKQTYTARIARRGDNFRSEYNMRDIVDDPKALPPGMGMVVSIVKEGAKKNYTLYPEKKKYIETELTDTEEEEPNVERKLVGEEQVDGHPCKKYRVRVTDKDGTISEGYVWEAEDLGGFIIKGDFEEEGIRTIMEMKNVKLITPPAELFEIPPGYRMVSGMMDIVTEE